MYLFIISRKLFPVANVKKWFSKCQLHCSHRALAKLQVSGQLTTPTEPIAHGMWVYKLPRWILCTLHFLKLWLKQNAGCFLFYLWWWELTFAWLQASTCAFKLSSSRLWSSCSDSEGCPLQLTSLSYPGIATYRATASSLPQILCSDL